MDTQNQRYIFTDFESIQNVKFKKLEKVCDKVFILINSSEKFIPFRLVRHLQRLGKRAKWIPVENNKNLTLNYHICYLMGKMHTKIEKTIEFAILSEDDAFDSIVSYINTNGRKCLRVRKKAEMPSVTKMEKPSPKNKKNGELATPTEKPEPKQFFTEEQEVDILEDTTRETLHRLRLVTNRPYNLDSLKDYIHINNQELVERGRLSVTEVIDAMKKNNNIEVKGSVIAYKF